MAIFPALEPVTRRYSMGVFPVTEEKGFGGGSVRFRHSTTAYSHNLELSFAALTQAEVKLLRDHYREQQGGYIAFPLSTEAWVGHTSFTDLVPTSTHWRYAAQPQEDHLTAEYVNVTISLISVPAVIAAASSGLASTVTATLAGGAASGS
jgi:hypothetical protein